MNVPGCTVTLKRTSTGTLRILSFRSLLRDWICLFWSSNNITGTEGRKVAVVDNDGLKYTGILKNVTKGGFDLEIEIRTKGKAKEFKEIPFNFDQINRQKQY